ncbi:4a-hydroxytetrahydrobiopterin dehydratase [Silvanigrella aquatica]|uniref:4a-hydroxytetrahydrobiopterin dehydratase n=1 Tax=Silvanigrella aquatica TaxID=1915309 RepID=A0A1L4CYJ2_9BACT|nr:4a-hydroxytetrahydrobiopterin dehydratase [Silvanigrella aquatica]APJ03019.1 hypothetical protein AXG55_03450 [Silvanigrella aquatica]
MKVYTIPFCPYCFRVKLLTSEKKIPSSQIQYDEIDLKNAPEELKIINPNLTVPTMVLEKNKGFPESLIIMEYIDKLNLSEEKLFGNNDKEIAQNKVLIEHISQEVTSLLLSCLFAKGSEMKLRQALEKLPQAFEKMDILLEQAQGSYFGGTKLNAVDMSFAPFLCYYLVAQEIYPRLKLPQESSKTGIYFKNIKENKYVQEVILNKKGFKDHIQTMISEPEYITTIKKSSRILVEDIEKEVKILNDKISSKIQNKNPIFWKINKNEKGPFIETTVTFKNYDEALKSVNKICDLQETSDHHSNFILDNLSQIKVEVCTHQPKWGVTAMDFAFAEALSLHVLS